MSQIGRTVPHPEWRLLVERLRELEYGGIVEHAELAQLSGLRYGTARYYQQTRQALKVLSRDYEVLIVNVPQVGYKRLEPVMHGKRAKELFNQGRKRIKRSDRVIQLTDFGQLSSEQIRGLEHLLLQIREVNALARRVGRSFKNVLPPVQSTKALPAVTDDKGGSVN